MGVRDAVASVRGWCDDAGGEGMQCCDDAGGGCVMRWVMMREGMRPVMGCDGLGGA